MYILEHARDNWGAVETQVMQALRSTFKPEFLNRVDDIIIFHPLGIEQLGSIVDLQLKRLRKLLTDRNLTLEVTDAAKKRLAEEGYEERPCRPWIAKSILPDWRKPVGFSWFLGCGRKPWFKA
jgi:ATP-dependent Clp protease ATP-binding subunit ClpA